MRFSQPLNAPSPIESTVAGIVTFVTPEPANAPEPMVVTPSGTSTSPLVSGDTYIRSLPEFVVPSPSVMSMGFSFSYSTPVTLSGSLASRLSGMITLSRLSRPSKRSSGTLSRVEGSTTVPRFSQPLNAPSPIESTPSVTTTLVILSQPVNAPPLMSVIPSGTLNSPSVVGGIVTRVFWSPSLFSAMRAPVSSSTVSLLPSGYVTSTVVLGSSISSLRLSG